MSIYTKDPATNVVTADATPGIVNNMIGGLQAPILGENKFLDAPSAFWASVEYGAIGAVAGGMFARARTNAGKKAIGGFLF
jgi:hypothetical protein